MLIKRFSVTRLPRGTTVSIESTTSPENAFISKQKRSRVSLFFPGCIFFNLVSLFYRKKISLKLEVSEISEDLGRSKDSKNLKVKAHKNQRI